MTDDRETSEHSNLLRAILALLADQRSREISPEKKVELTEVLLVRAGLDYRQVAELLGKKPDAIRMAINRAQREPS